VTKLAGHHTVPSADADDCGTCSRYSKMVVPHPPDLPAEKMTVTFCEYMAAN